MSEGLNYYIVSDDKTHVVAAAYTPAKAEHVARCKGVKHVSNTRIDRGSTDYKVSVKFNQFGEDIKEEVGTFKADSEEVAIFKAQWSKELLDLLQRCNYDDDDGPLVYVVEAVEEQIKIPVIWESNGEIVGTATNIKINKTGALVGADLDLDPEIKKLIDKMQQAPHKTGRPDYSKEKIFLENDWMYNRTTETSADCVNHAEPMTLESMAETMEELEKSRPNMKMKKSELFAHPEHAPGWLADEFEIVDIHVSENVEKGKPLILRDPNGEPLMMGINLVHRLGPAPLEKAYRVIIFVHPEDLNE